MDDEVRFLRRKGAANYLRGKYGFGAERTLAKGVTTGDTPAYHKAGRLVLYTREALDAWALAKMVLPAGVVARRHLVTSLCESAQDLFYRLVGRGLHFRAYLARGAFSRGRLENVEAFCGEALARARRRASEIQCTGLFIDDDVRPDCNVFLTTPYGSRCHFVHLMQSLENVGFGNIPYPIPAGLFASDLASRLAYDITYLSNVHANMNKQSLSPRVRVKYLSTWQMVRTRHRALLDALERNNFDPRSVVNLDWSEAMRSVGTAKGVYG